MRFLLLFALAFAGLSQAQSPVAPWAKNSKGETLPPYVADSHPNTPPPPGLYVAMGDSITFGVGVTPNCAPFPVVPVDVEQFCPTGGSYAVIVARALRKAGVPGHFMNIGIGGAHVERVLAEEIPYLPADATLVTLYIGTNDSRVVKDPSHSVDEVVAQYEKHYEELLSAIHLKAPRAKVVLINFPNQQYLAASYHVPDAVLPLYSAVSQALARFIDSHYPAYPVVDTICNPDSYDMNLQYKEGVHPNEEGAARLADRVLVTILSKSAPAPPTDCKWLAAK